MTIETRKLTIAGGPQSIGAEIPAVRSIPGGPWRVENPGEFEPGELLLRFDTDASTVRVERFV